MLEVLIRIIPFSLGVMISPVPIIVAILFASSRRRTISGPFFLFGWFVGLFFLVLFFSFLGVGVGSSGTPAFIHWVNLLLGLVLWWLAWLQWRNRKKDALPDWVQYVDDIEARRVAFFGFLFATVANPKNFPLTAATGIAIAESGLGLGWALIVGAVFAVFSSLVIALSVGLPFTKVGGKIMDRLKVFLESHATKIMIPLFLVLGAFIIISSVQGIATG